MDEPGVARTHREAPDIDGVVHVDRRLGVGEFHKVVVTRRGGARPVGRAVTEPLRERMHVSTFGPSALKTPANAITVARLLATPRAGGDDRRPRRGVGGIRRGAGHRPHRRGRRVAGAPPGHHPVGRVPRPSGRQGRRGGGAVRGGGQGRGVVDPRGDHRGARGVDERVPRRRGPARHLHPGPGHRQDRRRSSKASPSCCAWRPRWRRTAASWRWRCGWRSPSPWSPAGSTSSTAGAPRGRPTAHEDRGPGGRHRAAPGPDRRHQLGVDGGAAGAGGDRLALPPGRGRQPGAHRARPAQRPGPQRRRGGVRRARAHPRRHHTRRHRRGHERGPGAGPRHRRAHRGAVQLARPVHAREQPTPGRRPRRRHPHPPAVGHGTRAHLPGGPQGGLRPARRALRARRDVQPGRAPRPAGSGRGGGRVGGDHQPGGADLGDERVGSGRAAGPAHRGPRRRSGEPHHRLPGQRDRRDQGAHHRQGARRGEGPRPARRGGGRGVRAGGRGRVRRRRHHHGVGSGCTARATGVSPWGSPSRSRAVSWRRVWWACPAPASGSGGRS